MLIKQHNLSRVNVSFKSVELLLVRSALRQKLWAGYDFFDQAFKSKFVGRQLCSHLVDRRLVRKYQAAAQCIGQHFSTQVVEELVSTLFGEIL